MNDNEVAVRIVASAADAKAAFAETRAAAREAASEIKSSFSGVSSQSRTAFGSMKADMTKVSAEMREIASTANAAGATSARAWLNADAALVKLAAAQAAATREIKAAKIALNTGEASLEEYNAALLRTKSALSLVESEHRQAMAELRKKLPANDTTPAAGGGIGSMRGTLAGIGIAVGINEVMQLGRAVVSTSAEFQRLRAVLTTLEGSEGGGSARFAALKKFATETPYELTEVVTAFAKLKSQGLDPSNEALRSYGNTASAMGKSLEQMVEAVSDAAMGQYERLKEFGIKAQDAGDHVVMSFKGVSTSVAKNSEDIQAYLEKIGNSDFAGAMDRQMKTLGGSFSNVQDAAASFADEIGEGGLSAALIDVMGGMTNAASTSDELAHTIGSVLGETVRLVGDFIKTFGDVGSAVFGTLKDVVAAFVGKSNADFLTFGNIVQASLIAIRAFADGVRIAFSIIGGVIQSAINAFMTFADVVDRAMRFDFSGAIEAVRDGVERQVAIVKDGSERIKSIAADTRAAISRMSGPGNSAASGALGMFNQAKDAGISAMTQPKPGGTSFGTTPKTGGGASSGGAKTSAATKLQEELEAKKLAWAMEQDAQESYQQYSLQSEADFWALALKRSDLNAKDRLAVEKQYLAAKAALLKERQQHETDDAKQVQALAIETAKTETELAKLTLHEKIAAIDEAEKAGAMSAARSLQMQANLNRELYALDVQLENREYEARLRALRAEQDVLGEKPGYYRRIQNQIEMLEAQHQNRMVLLNRQADAKILQDNKKLWLAQHKLQLDAIKGLSASWGNTLGQMLTLQTSFANGVKSLYQGLANVIGSVLGSIIEQWLQKQLTALILGHAAQAASGVAMVTSNAAVAASGAYAATALIPFVGPMLAPAAAATAFAGAMAFAPLASAEGGDWQVREGLYKLHADEMVLPAWAASPLRNMVRSGAANDQLPFASNDKAGGDTHHWHVSAVDGPSVRRLFMDNKSHIYEAMRKHLRDGGR